MHVLRQLVYSSTCAVYGNPESLPVTEATPPKPINPYGQSKLMAEEVMRGRACVWLGARVRRAAVECLCVHMFPLVQCPP